MPRHTTPRPCKAAHPPRPRPQLHYTASSSLSQALAAPLSTHQTFLAGPGPQARPRPTAATSLSLRHGHAPYQATPCHVLASVLLRLRGARLVHVHPPLYSTHPAARVGLGSRGLSQHSPQRLPPHAERRSGTEGLSQIVFKCLVLMTVSRWPCRRCSFVLCQSLWKQFRFQAQPVTCKRLARDLQET